MINLMPDKAASRLVLAPRRETATRALKREQSVDDSEKVKDLSAGL